MSGKMFLWMRVMSKPIFVPWTTKQFKALKNSRAHWKRMIKWVEKQPQQERPQQITMRFCINEEWNGDYCACCQMLMKIPGCDLCPFMLFYKVHCYDKGWGSVDEAKTWERWLIFARRLHTNIDKMIVAGGYTRKAIPEFDK